MFQQKRRRFAQDSVKKIYLFIFTYLENLKLTKVWDSYEVVRPIIPKGSIRDSFCMPTSDRFRLVQL